MTKSRIMSTTLGELIAALADETAPYVRDDKTKYRMVALMLVHLLKHPPRLRRIDRRAR